MKIIRSWFLLLSLALQARAEGDLVGKNAGEAKYDPIEDTCNHPVLLSAAAFASNFFCENVLKVAIEDMDCDVLRFRVIDAQAQIISGANFRQTIALVDEERKCVIAFRTKVLMPLPHSGVEPLVDMDEIEALACDTIDYEDNCLQRLTMIDAYWEEEIEMGGGEVSASTEEEWEKQAVEEEEVIEEVEEDLEESGMSGITGSNTTSLPSTKDTTTMGGDVLAAQDFGINAVPLKSNNASTTNEENAPASLPVDNTPPSTREEVIANLDINTPLLPANQAPPTSGLDALASENPSANVAAGDVLSAQDFGINGAPLKSNNASTTNEENAPASLPVGNMPPSTGEEVLANLDINTNQAPPTSGLDALASENPSTNVAASPPAAVTNNETVTTIILSAEPNADLTPAEALAEEAITDLVGSALQTTNAEEAAEVQELVEEAKEEIVEEIAQFEEQLEAEAISGPYETEDMDEYEDETTWAFAGKTDECSRFGVSPAEGIAFKCGTTAYICGETITFREKFLLLLQDSMVDGCDMGEVTEIFTSRGDCNFFPKNEHYLKRDGTQREGHHLFCPNGQTLDSYYMFCSMELDNYYCDGSDCETCAGTSRRYLRH